jgi:trimeric autotransporter adhesin
MMKNNKLIILLIILGQQKILYAQQNVGIGTNSPNPSAILDIKSNTKGLLIPRVPLISETDVATISNPAVSLLVYNTGNLLPDGEGHYFWSGTKWSKFATRSNLANLAWGVTGNTGTNAATDFIGTIDDKPLVFKTNNIESGKIDGLTNNVFFGRGAGKFTSGINNSFFGNQSGSGNLSGIQNTAIGAFALENNVTGDNNVAIGLSALRTGIISTQNTAVGTRALFSLNNTGGDNTALGYEAGKNLIGGDNTLLGSNTIADNSNGASISNSTVIGAGATVSANETMAFGNQFVKQWVFAISETTSSEHALEVGSAITNGNGAYLTKTGTWTNVSDANKKEDFVDLNATDLLQKISQLNIQRWKYKGSNEYHIGPTAQNFYKLFGLGTDDKGISTVDPAGIALAAIKEQQRIIEKQNEQILRLQKRVEVLEGK